MIRMVRSKIRTHGFVWCKIFVSYLEIGDVISGCQERRFNQVKLFRWLFGACHPPASGVSKGSDPCSNCLGTWESWDFFGYSLRYISTSSRWLVVAPSHPHCLYPLQGGEWRSKLLLEKALWWREFGGFVLDSQTFKSWGSLINFRSTLVNKLVIASHLTWSPRWREMTVAARFGRCDPPYSGRWESVLIKAQDVRPVKAFSGNQTWFAGQASI